MIRMGGGLALVGLTRKRYSWDMLKTYGKSESLEGGVHPAEHGDISVIDKKLHTPHTGLDRRPYWVISIAVKDPSGVAKFRQTFSKRSDEWHVSLLDWDGDGVGSDVMNGPRCFANMKTLYGQAKNLATEAIWEKVKPISVDKVPPVESAHNPARRTKPHHREDADTYPTLF